MILSSHGLQLMTDVVGNPEEERRASFYHEPWSQEAVSRYFYCKVRKVNLGVVNSCSSVSRCSREVFSVSLCPVFHHRSSRGDRSWNRP